MSAPVPPRRVPTLTEVVTWPDAARAAGTPPPAAAGPAEADVVSTAAASSSPLATTTLTEEQLVQRVLADVQRQVDLVLEYRLREALTPLLSRVADQLIRDARGELASTLRDVVTRAVAQELARHRTR